MGNTEYVDKLVAEGFFDDVERLKKELPLLAASMEQLSKAGRDVNAALGSTRTLKDVVENTDKATKVNETASRTVKVLTEDTLKLNMAIKAQNDALKLNVQIAQAQDGSIAKEILLVKQLTAERNRLNLETQKGRAEELKAQIDAKNDWIKSNSDKLSAQKINIGNYPEMMAQMAAIRNEMVQMEAAGLKGTQVFADMEGKLTEISRAMGPTSAQLTSLTNSMTFLAQAGKQDTQEFKDMQQQAMALRVNMNQVKQAISGTTSSMQAQSGAARSSNQATFAMSQIMREMPSFAYSASTGILALSNNIPMLGDSIANLKQKNEELVASGQKAIPVWKSLGLAIFSVNGIITLAVSAITIIAARMAMAGNETKKAADNLTEYNDALQQFYNTSNKMRSDVVSEVKFEESKARSQVKIMQDQTMTLDQRFRAYKELQRIAPQIFDDLDKEGFKTAENTKRISDQVAALDRYIEVQTLISKGRTQQRRNLELIEANEDLAAVKRAEVQEERLRLIRGGNGRMAVTPAWVDKVIREVGTKTEVGVGALDVEKRQAELNKLLEERLALEQSAQRLETGLANLDVQRAKMEGNTTSAKDRKSKKEDAENEFQVTLDRYVILAQTREQYEAEQEAKFQARLAVTKQMELALQDQRTKALNDLNAEYDKNGISFEEYTKRKATLDKNFVYTSLILHREYYKALQKEYPNDERLEKLISDANAAIANLQRENNKAKGKEFGGQDAAALTQQAAQQSIQTTSALWDGYYQKQINRQEDLLDSIQKRKTAEIDAINNTMQSEDKKQKQIQALNAQTAQQEKQLQAEMRRLKREQAIADRIAGVLRVVENTAGGVTRAMHDYKWPFSLIPAGIVAGIGAAQVAAIFAQPLPQYGDGTPKDKVGHPGGPAIIGDKPEWVIEPGKAPYFTSSTHIRNLPRFTRVVPEKDMVTGSMGFLTPQLMQSIYGGGNDMGGIEKKLEENAQMIASAIKNKPETTFIASNGEFKKIVRRGNSYIEYLNDNFN